MKTVVENNVDMTTVSRFTYRYDELGRRTDRVDEGATFGTDELSTWGYDELGQVVEQNRHAGNNPDSPGSAIAAENFEFSYDHIGNRLSSQQGTATARAYGSNPLNQYTSITNPGASPQYDDDGNMTFDGVEWYFTWDGENRLIFARSYQTTASNGDKQISFVYDYQSRRVEKLVEEFNGSVWNATTHRRFVYDGWNLLAELEEDTSEWETAQTYLWGLDLTQSFEGAGGVGGLLSITMNDARGTTNYYPTYDANGNVMELYDELGNNAAIYRYGPFGELVSISESVGVRNPYKFSTKYFDEELELYYYGYRYYDPETGRWLNRDPIEERGGLNLYGFVGNDGVNWVDVSGLYKKKRKDVETSSGSVKIDVIEVEKCEIVILYGHGHSSVAHEFSFSSGCSGGEFVGCFPSTTNSTISLENRLPNPDMGNSTKTTGPGGNFHTAMVSVQKRARDKANAICKEQSNCCTSISISYQLQGGFLEWLYQPSYSDWNETIDCSSL